MMPRHCCTLRCMVLNCALVNRSGLFQLQPCHQRFTRGIRLGLQPHQHVAPNTFEGIPAGSPVPGTSHTGRVRRSDLTLAPQTG